MKDNKININVEWDLELDETSLNEQIEQSIISAATKEYMDGLEKTFEGKLESMLHKQAYKIVKNIGEFELDKCNANGLKETISIEDFIAKKAVESLNVKTNSSGEVGNNGYNNREKFRTTIEWVIHDVIIDKDNQFIEAMKKQIAVIEKEYQDKLQEIVGVTLSPIYKKLVDKLNS